MKITIAQIKVRTLRCEENFSKIKECVIKAKEDNCDMIIFPANVISGYLLGSNYLNNNELKLIDSYNNIIKEFAVDIAVVWGNIKYRGNKLFNCIFYAFGNEIHTRVLCDNDMLQMNKEYFSFSDIKSCIHYKGESIYLTSKDDIMENSLNIILDNNYYQGEQIKYIDANVIYVNSLGMQNVNKNIVYYYGGSYVANNSSVYSLGLYEENLMVYDTNVSLKNRKDKISKLDVLINCIKDFDEVIFNKSVNWVIGLSGGLDSTINAALLVAALGSKRVIGYNLASNYNSQLTKDNAKQTATNLGVEYRCGNIEELKQSTIATLQTYGYKEKDMSTLAIENIQARLRGHLLSSFASLVSGVVCNNGNKVEVALGYCTLYGDSIGAIAPLADLTKVDLFEISHELNKYFNAEVVPLSLLPKVNNDSIIWEMPPSAELKDKQFDPMKWFYHDKLIEIYLQDGNLDKVVVQYDKDKLKTLKLDKWITYYKLHDRELFIKDINWLVKTMNINGFKRLQLPPIIVMSKYAYGNKIEEVQGVETKQYK